MITLFVDKYFMTYTHPYRILNESLKDGKIACKKSIFQQLSAKWGMCCVKIFVL